MNKSRPTSTLRKAKGLNSRDKWRLAKAIANAPKKKSRPALKHKSKQHKHFTYHIRENRKQRYARWCRESKRWKEIKEHYYKTVSYKDCEICDESKGLNVHHRFKFAYWIFGPGALSGVLWFLLKLLPPIKWVLLRICFIMLCSNHHNALHKWAHKYHVPLAVASIVYVHYARTTNLFRAFKQLFLIILQIVLVIIVFWSVNHFDLLSKF